jgi:hypothetical protein
LCGGRLCCCRWSVLVAVGARTVSFQLEGTVRCSICRVGDERWIPVHGRVNSDRNGCAAGDEMGTRDRRVPYVRGLFDSRSVVVPPGFLDHVAHVFAGLLKGGGMAPSCLLSMARIYLWRGRRCRASPNDPGRHLASSGDGRSRSVG